MRVSFGGFETEMPTGWADESTVVYTMPQEDAPATLPSSVTTMKMNGPLAAASIAVAWEPLPAASCTVDDYLKARIESFKRNARGMSVVEQGKVGDSAIPFAVYTLPSRIPVLQMMLVKRVGARIVCVTGTARASTFERVRLSFVTAAEQLAPER